MNYPFNYRAEDAISLSPYLNKPEIVGGKIIEWASEIWNRQEKIQTFSLLNRINQKIFQFSTYIKREKEGVQSAEWTIASGSGSCRDFACLFMAIDQYMGFAARFVSGYIFSGADQRKPQSTHAWVEIFIPGAGWKGFDPTLGTIAGEEHIATSLARHPELVPPISGSFYGNAAATMSVEVWVTETT